MLARISTEGLQSRNAFVHRLCSTLLTERTAAFTLYELTNVLVIGYYEVCQNVLIVLYLTCTITYPAVRPLMALFNASYIIGLLSANESFISLSIASNHVVK